MIDFYKRLDLPADASDEQIRQSVHSANPKLRAEAEAILLQPRRRAVYDRNRQLLVTIAALRDQLGLNYTRFWSRSAFKDFWRAPEFVPPPSPEPERPKRRVDKMMIAQAFHTARRVHHHTRHHAARLGAWWWAAAVLFTGLVTLLTLWYAAR